MLAKNKQINHIALSYCHEPFGPMRSMGALDWLQGFSEEGVGKRRASQQRQLEELRSQLSSPSSSLSPVMCTMLKALVDL